MRHVLLPCLIAAVAASGCATKKYVGREVGEVNQKVDTLNSEMEKTQERVKRSEVRIDDVDRESKSGIADAKGSAEKALVRATEAERAAKGKLIYTVTLSNDKVTFPVNRAAVAPDARQLVDEAIAQLKAENRGVFFEIEGHTDSTGPETYNTKLGEERARGGAQLHPRPARDRAQPHGGHLLRRDHARGRQQEPRQPRAEPPGGDQGPRVEPVRDGQGTGRGGAPRCRQPRS